MFKKSIYILTLAAVLTSVSTPAFAGWVTDQDAQSTVSRMKSEDLLQTRADGYFAITLDEIPLNYAIDVVILNQKGSRRISSYC